MTPITTATVSEPLELSTVDALEVPASRVSTLTVFVFLMLNMEVAIFFCIAEGAIVVSAVFALEACALDWVMIVKTTRTCCCKRRKAEDA